MANAAAPTWKKVIAAILDFFTVFLIGGFIIAKLIGAETEDGFELKGLPAILLFALIATYFVVGHRYAGGTIWQRIFKTNG